MSSFGKLIKRKIIQDLQGPGFLKRIFVLAVVILAQKFANKASERLIKNLKGRKSF